ncbi:MAG: L-serine ammonia-lyase, iron-sulfur-dependent subunit beta [Oscillospiraceae bacterium]
MNVFHIIGPVMIGPSSSHTGGAVRIGRMARALINGNPVKADILLHGSFAQTYKGHGTDKALVAGILGMYPDDTRIRTSLQHAKEAGLEINITTGEIPDAHPNTAIITLTDDLGVTVVVQGSSIGGGNIVITKINSLNVSITGQHASVIVLHNDATGTIAAVTAVLADKKINVSNFIVNREKKGGRAVMTFEIDGDLDSDVTADLKKTLSNLENVINTIVISPV